MCNGAPRAAADPAPPRRPSCYHRFFGGAGPLSLGVRRLGGPAMAATCPDCGTAWGQLHEPFCIKERCPFCGGQLVACDCIFTVLDLDDAEREAVEEFEDDTVEPLRGIVARWRAAVQ